MHGLNVSDFALGCKQQEGFIDKSCPLDCYLGDKQTEQNRKSTKCTWGQVSDPLCSISVQVELELKIHNVLKTTCIKRPTFKTPESALSTAFTTQWYAFLLILLA